MSNEIYSGLDEYNVEFSLYGGCKVNCEYCPHLTLAKKLNKKKISLEEFKIIVDKIPKNVGIGFSGMVEPLFHNDFDKMVKYVLSSGHKAICCTTLPDEPKNNVECFLNEKNWSYRSLHLRDEFMSYKNNSTSYYKNLERFFCSVQKNPQTNEVYYHTKKLDNNISFLLKKYKIENLANYVFPYKRIKTKIKFKSFENSFKKGKIFCSHNHHKVTHILPDGDAVLCCMDIEKAHVLGNLLYNSYENIINGEEYKKIIRGFENELENTICRYCVFAKET